MEFVNLENAKNGSILVEHFRYLRIPCLMTEIIACAERMKLRKIELEVVADNVAAIALYNKVGFSDIGIYKDFWFTNNTYSDAIVDK